MTMVIGRAAAMPYSNAWRSSPPLVTTFSCVACGNAADSGSTADKSAAQSQGKHEKVKKSATQGLDGAHLRDNDSLYKVYDDSGVETMYLTVSRGNKSEGTDHSWSEINQYSVDDYAAMRTNRYQVNGLLQVGDEQGACIRRTRLR